MRLWSCVTAEKPKQGKKNFSLKRDFESLTRMLTRLLLAKSHLEGLLKSFLDPSTLKGTNREGKHPAWRSETGRLHGAASPGLSTKRATERGRRCQ